MPIDVFEYGKEKTLTENRFTKDGYTFKNWIYDNNGVLEEIPGDYNKSTLSRVIDDTVTLIANWQGKEYEVEYHGNGATRGSMPVDHATYGEVYYIRDNAYEKDGYEFEGFGRGTDSIAEFFRGSTLDSETYREKYDLYAIWKSTSSIA